MEGVVEGDDTPLAPVPPPIIERHLKAARIGDGLKAQKRIAQGKRSGALGNTPAQRICALKRQKHKSARRLRGTPKPPLRCEAPPTPRPALFRMVTFRMATLHYNPPACGATRKRKSKETEAGSAESARQGKARKTKKGVPGALRSGDTVKKAGGCLLSRFRSTIGAAGLNFSVRDGKRWCPGAMAAINSKRHKGQCEHRRRERRAERGGLPPLKGPHA